MEKSPGFHYGINRRTEKQAHFAAIHRVPPAYPNPADGEIGQLRPRHQLEIAIAIATAENSKSGYKTNQVTQGARKNHQYPFPPASAACRRHWFLLCATWRLRGKEISLPVATCYRNFLAPESEYTCRKTRSIPATIAPCQ